jgi:hypothetical protein
LAEDGADFIEGISPEAYVVINLILDDAPIQDMNFIPHDSLAGHCHIVCRGEDKDIVRTIV